MIKSTFIIVLLGLAMLFFIGNTKVTAQVLSGSVQKTSKNSVGNSNQKSETNAKSTKSEISQPCKVKTYIRKEVGCNTANDGILDLEVLSGTPPFKIEWSNGATTNQIKNLKSGVYAVRVTDANGSVDIKSLELKAPSVLRLDYKVNNVSAKGKKDGSIEIKGLKDNHLIKGFGPNGMRITSVEQLKDLSEGKYLIVVFDKKGCSVSINTEVSSTNLNSK